LIKGDIMELSEAFAVVKQAMVDDPDYAHGWHANLACCAKDEGVNHEAAQNIASRFMKLAFDINTKE
jgi:hypothetical protein